MKRFPGGRTSSAERDGLYRIEEALRQVISFLRDRDIKQVNMARRGGSPTTSLDREVDRVLHAELPRKGEGWLSEESRDDFRRLKEHLVWIVDPIDGTREFLLGNGEWCVSIALVQGGYAIAGGVLNPSTGEMFLGGRSVGLTISGTQEGNGIPRSGGSARVLVSRKEHQDGKCRHLDNSALTIVPLGSVAYRLARVAAGWAEATCTFAPRHEWDVAAGVALIRAGGGTVQTFNGEDIRFNRPRPRVDRLLALSRHCDVNVPNLLLGAMA